MNRNIDLDERHLWIRGDVYKHIVNYLIGLLLLDAFLEDIDVIWAEGMYSSLIILMVSITAGAVEMVIRDVFIMKGAQKFLIYLMGILNTIILIAAIMEMITSKAGMIEQSHLSVYGSQIIIHGSIILVFIIYLIKVLYMKRHEINKN